jgi:uncharacterized protein (UPF0548 family)
MPSLVKPSPEAIRHFLARQAGQPFSYPAVGHSRSTPPPGYDVDHRRTRLGEGQSAFDAACAALRRWEMFHLGWVHLCWPDTPIQPGAVVAVLASLCGVWWLNACRIVYVIDETAPLRRFGFAYGTLPDHAERGEERFTVEWRDDDSVWYDLLAFSQPRHWLARLGYPLTRHYQKRFGLGSLAAMSKAVQTVPFRADCEWVDPA